MSETSLPQTARKSKWVCGFCGNGNHERCVAGIANLGSVLRCACKVHPPVIRCLECGNTNPDELTGWACSNPSDCRDAIAARSAANPLRKELELVKQLGGEARRRALAERLQAQIRVAVRESGIDEQIGHDVAADLDPDRPRKPRAPRKPREPRATEGICICGCEGPTRGGRFQPGHDARLKSALKKAIKGGDESARTRMIELGWEKFIPVAA